MRWASASWSGVILLATIFPPIAVHVVEAKGVCGEAADRQRIPSIDTLAARIVGAIAVEICLSRGNPLTRRKRRRHSSADRIFPLSFGEQSIGFSRLAG